MSNTQVRYAEFNEAIARDRAARLTEADAGTAEEPRDFYGCEQDTHRHPDLEFTHPWELWIAIGVGLLVIAVAAAI